MASVAQELQLVAMKAIARVGEKVQQRNGGRDGDDDREIGATAGARIILNVCGRQTGLLEAISD
jgi:hypothetical protein